VWEVRERESERASEREIEAEREREQESLNDPTPSTHALHPGGDWRGGNPIVPSREV